MPVRYATAVVNGITYKLELGADGYYHAVIPAPQAPDTDLVEYRSYSVVLNSEDTAGNVATKDGSDPELGEYLSLVVKEKIFIETKHWKPKDLFNATDYNRIKYNICYIKRIADIIYGSVEFEGMGADKTWEEYPEPKDFWQMARNLNYICQAAELNWEKYGRYEANQPFLDYEDLNHIEEACQMLFERLYGIIKARKRLPFQLGKRGIL